MGGGSAVRRLWSGRSGARRVVPSERREEDDVTNGVLVGQQHHQTVDSYSLARRRGHAVAERLDVVGVEVHRLVIARLPGFNLCGEATGLVDRVVTPDGLLMVAELGTSDLPVAQELLRRLD